MDLLVLAENPTHKKDLLNLVMESDEIMELRYAPDREIIQYLGITPKQLYRKLLPLKTEAEMQEVLVGDLMYEAVAEHLDDFPTNRQ